MNIDVDVLGFRVLYKSFSYLVGNIIIKKDRGFQKIQTVVQKLMLNLDYLRTTSRGSNIYSFRR